MSYERRRRGFERAGRVPLKRLGLSKSRARELVLTAAWDRLAGPAIASHTRAVSLRRGLLSIEIDDGPWAATLADLMPRLSGRLAAEHPELGVRQYRLVRRGSERAEPAREVLPCDEPVTSTGGTTAAAPDSTAAPSRPIAERLPEVVRRYLARRKT